MSRLPYTTPAPTSIFAPAMSPAIKPPSPRNGTDTDKPGKPDAGSGAPSGGPPVFPMPKFRLEIRDLKHPGAKRFLKDVNAADCMATAAQGLLRLLYTSPDDPTTNVPPTRSITLILRDMPGVAYTTGSDLDGDHKEVHFSLAYIAGIDSARGTHEITGVISHEFVHCYQYNALNTCPGGLIEGIADWVRLHLDLSPPHWKREAGGSWDGGYQKTAYFLEYLEDLFGEGTVIRINEKLRLQRYDEDPFWTDLFGCSVHQLWEGYSETLKSCD